MAMALKEGKPIRGAEAVAERPDGVRVPFMAYPTPLHDESGRLIGAVNTLVDITERKRAEEISRRLASIVQNSDDAIVSKDLNGIIATWNSGAERLFGYTAEEVVGKPITILIPLDRYGEESEILGRIRRGERIDHYETVRRRKDGSLVEISLTASPVANADGTIVGVSKIARDITERKRAQEQQNLVVGEMSHRVKNLFAVASGIVALSARCAKTPQDLAGAVQERLRALSRAHELTRPGLVETVRNPGQEMTLLGLVQAIFAPYVEPAHALGKECLVAKGPEVPIGEGAVTSLALILHELTTNAAKYGALSSSSGFVRIDWSVKKDVLRLVWKEHGGPRLDKPPESEGFGSSLIHRIVASQFRGEVCCDWKSEGLILHLSVPVGCLAK